MPEHVEAGLFVLLLGGFLGLEVIHRVPPLFHTPLMSLTNAIAAISLVGSLVLAGSDGGTTAKLLGAVAVGASTLNVVGGFVLTDRMLRMFRGPRRDAEARS
jgi:proton-translocating NAD(P)+ transhydrogenase subunit alpha